MSVAARSAPVRTGLAVLCLLYAHAESVRADDQRTNTLATVDVSERSRDSAQPLALEVLDANAIEDGNLRELDQLQDRIANLRIGTLGGRASQSIVSLRGFTNPYGAPQSAVVLNVDGIPVEDFYTFGERLFDIARIEVLKGPQGTGGGPGAEAGVINVVTRKPTDASRAFADANLQSRGGYDLAGGASGALAENVYTSVAAAKDGGDGYLDNVVGDRPFNHRDGANLRTRVLWQPDERWEFDSTLLARHVDDRGGEIYLPVDLASFNALPTLAGARVGRFDAAIDYEGFSRLDSTLASISGSFSTDAVIWHAQASARHGTVHNATDYDLSPQPWFVMDSRYRVDQDHAQISVQSREPAGAPWNWIAGISGDHRDFDFLRVLHAGSGNSFQLPIGDYTRTDALLIDSTYAAFAQANWRFGDTQRWTLGAGVRQERAQRGVEFRANAIDPRTAALSRTDSQSLPKLTLDYRLAPGHFTYVSIARGWKPGGYNTNAFSADATSYAPEKTAAIEIGLKGGSGAASYALALFRNNVHHYQDLVISEDNLASYIVNAPRVRTQGVEAEIDWHPAAAWSIGTSLGAVHAVYVDDPLNPATGFRLDGHRLENVPRWNGNAHADYVRGDWNGRVEIAAAGGFLVDGYNGTADVFHEQHVSGYTVLNAKFGYRGAGWSAHMFGANLGNRRYFTTASFGFSQLAGYSGAVGNVAQSRTFGVEYRWEL
jgi:iron complex outermembrane receptor protein